MAKRMRVKRRLKFGVKMGLSISIIFISFLYMFHILYDKFLKDINNESLISTLVDYNLSNKKEHNLFYDLINLDSTNFLLKYTLGVEDMHEEAEEVNGFETEYIEDPYKPEVTEPILYIYNTHQTEGYQKSNNASYNITPSVLMASYILRESLNDLGVPTLVETNDITEVLRIHNWKYKYSYAASKLLLQDAMEKNKSLKYFIDLHRDSMSHEITTTSWEGKNYAKEFAESLNNYIKNISPTLTRGISLKGGSGVNGIYNQDMSPNAILIELGGQYNNITEINNTLTILSKAIHSYVKGEI